MRIWALVCLIKCLYLGLHGRGEVINRSVGIIRSLYLFKEA